MEARSFSQEKSQQLMRKVKEYKADLKKITEDSRQAQGAASGICMPINIAAFCLPLHQSHVHDRLASRLLPLCTPSLASGLHICCRFTEAVHKCRIGRPYRDAQDRQLWRDKTCPART